MLPETKTEIKGARSNECKPFAEPPKYPIITPYKGSVYSELRYKLNILKANNPLTTMQALNHFRKLGVSLFLILLAVCEFQIGRAHV